MTTIQHATDERFRLLFENSLDIIHIMSDKAEVSFVTPSVKNILGYTPREFKMLRVNDVVHPEDMKVVIATMNALMARPGATIGPVEERIKHKDGSWRWMEIVGINLIGTPGIDGIMITSRDITVRKETETNLRDAKIAARNVLEDLSVEKSKVEMARAKEQAILLSIGEGLIVTDENGIIILINNAAEKLLGKKSEDVMHKVFSDVIRIEDEKGAPVGVLEYSTHIVSEVASNTSSLSSKSTYYYVRDDKTRFPVAIITTSVTMDNKVIGTIEVFRDITKEKEIDRAKSEFISLASHQLKTPPTIIKLLTERLLGNKMGALTDKQKEYIDDIHFSTERMIDLVNALLNVSRIELGAFTIQASVKDACAIVASVLGELKSVIEKKPLRLEEVYPKGGISLSLDEPLFRMVLGNLVINSLHYTAEGGLIHVECKKMDKGQVEGNKAIVEDSLVIVVTDTGYGIPHYQQDKLFTKFFRADNAREKLPDGTGLGLYIVKSVLDNSGGSIWFTSEENKGTTFYVAIPMTGMKERVPVSVPEKIFNT